MSDSYDTRLTTNEEDQYLSWVNAESIKRGRDISLDTQDYDLRGYWKHIASLGNGKDGHLPDTYKKPNHPTFSDESKYSSDDHIGGTWDNEGNFHPSDWNIKQAGGITKLRDYFTKYEPSSKLIFSNAQKIYMGSGGAR